MNKNDFGSFLAKLRTDKKITQEKLGEKLNVNSKTISKWECGQSVPDIETLCDIANFFNLSLYELRNCKRIDSPFITTHDIKKIINKNSIKNIFIKKWLMIIICFFVISLIIFCISYTFNNYGKVEVYEIISADENFDIGGYLTKTNSDNYLCINKITYKKNDEIAKSYVKNITFHLSNINTIYNQMIIQFPKKQLFTDSLDKISFHLNKNFDYTVLDSYKITIYYSNQKDEKKKIEAKIKFEKVYRNNKLKYFSKFSKVSTIFLNILR